MIDYLSEIGEKMMIGFYHHYKNDLSSTPKFGIWSQIKINQNWKISFQTWGDSDILFIVLLDKNGRSKFKFDLSRVIKNSDNTFTVYLSRPTNHITKSVLDKHLEWFSQIDLDYIEKVKFIKDSIEGNKKVQKGGYYLVKNGSLNEVINKLITIQTAIMEQFK